MQIVRMLRLQILEQIFIDQSTPFRINLGFGYVLFNRTEDVFKYFYNSTNNLLFEKCATISNRQDIQEFFERISNLDLQTNYYLKKTDSSYVLAALTNLSSTLLCDR